MTTHQDGVVAPTFTGDVIGDVAGNVTGTQVNPAAPTVYTGADAANKAILPSEVVASMTKATAATDMTLAAPGAANINKYLLIYSTTAAAHVVTVTGLLGGTTMTFGAAIGNSMLLYSVSATAWVAVSKNGVTQS